jgi:hypothetical protein
MLRKEGNTDMLAGIIAAPFWLLLTLTLVMGAALAITARGRGVLRSVGRTIRRPIGALLFGASGAGLCSLMTTIAIYCFHTRPPYVDLKGVLAVLLFGLVGLIAWVPVVFVRSLPLFLLVWVPLWISRNRVLRFWRWWTAPLVGAILSYTSWLIIDAIDPIFPEGYMHPELIKAALVGVIASGAFMFAAGCKWPFLKRRSKPQTPPISPPPNIEGAETGAT